MVAGFGAAVAAWLLKWPTPWDVLATLAAIGSLFLQWRNRVDRRTSEKPIIAATCWRRNEGWVAVRLQVTNPAQHDVVISRVRVISPRSALINVLGRTDNAGRWDFVTPAVRAQRVDWHVARAGTESPIGPQLWRASDRTYHEFVAYVPEGGTSLKIGIMISAFRHDARPKERTIWLRNIEPATIA